MKLITPSLLLITVGFSLIYIAHAQSHWGWWWRIRPRCDTEITVTIASSECSRPLEGVYIWASGNSKLINSSGGVYTLRVCRLPITIYMWKYGFRFTWRIVRHTTENVILQCTGSGCEGTTSVQASVLSSCGQPLDGVTFESQAIKSVTTGPSAGMYKLEVCSLPLEVTCTKDGYESLTSTINGSPAEMQMICTGSNCGGNEITLQIHSSDCNQLVSGVTITSSGVMSAAETEPGNYVLEVCNMPVSISLEKEGFELMSTTVSATDTTVALTCSAPLCTAEPITVSVTSECGTLLDGVQLTSAGVPIQTTSPSIGVYELSVCDLPKTVRFEKAGYEMVTHEITGDAETVRMICNAGSCGHLQKAITVRSSDCKTLVGDVTITSPTGDFLLVTTTDTGLYQLEACGFPIEIMLEKDGFLPKSDTIETGVSDIELQCNGPACTASNASFIVTSECTGIPVVGVAIGGPDVIDVTSSAPGTYQIEACTLPTLANFKLIGYEAQQTVVNDGATVTLSCIELPVIVTDPQSKYRNEDENVTLCCQAKPDTGVTYKWYKDGTELAGEINNELSLTTLGPNDQGSYQCSVKLTADPSLPAVRSEEAMLTITADSNSCGDAWRPLRLEVYPSCCHNVNQCLKRRCRSAGNEDSCSDNNECCAVTQTEYPACANRNAVEVIVDCTCSCPATNTIVVRGIVEDSDTDSPIPGITVTLVGDTDAVVTDITGEYSLNSVPTSRRRLLIKVSDPTGNYLDNIFVHMLSSQSFGPQIVNIPMVKKAAFTEIDPTTETVISISNQPRDQNAGPAFIRIPPDAFFSTNGEKYTGPVFVSLTFIDPSDRLEDAPGEFTTLNSEGLREILVTFGVFAFYIKDVSGNQIILNENIEVYANGPTPYLLWQLDENTATWIQIENDNLPGRKKRQATNEQLIGSFIPQSGRWYNIDYVYNEPKCYFKTRVFLDDFSAGSEVTNTLTVVPSVRQIIDISSNTSNGVKYLHEGSMTGCFEIRCPSETASAKISAVAYETILGVQVETPLMPAALTDYSASVKAILQGSPYNYALFSDDTSKIFVNTPRTVGGPFYESMDTCKASTFDEPAFWFAKQPEFIEGDFYDGTEDRCVGRILISIWSISDPDTESDFTSASINALSIWADNKYGLKTATIYTVEAQESSITFASCFEYRCSIENLMTSVYINISDSITAQYDCYFYKGRESRRKRLADSGNAGLDPPILNSAEMHPGYFLNSDVQQATNQCLADTEHYVGVMYCNPFYAMPAK